LERSTDLPALIKRAKALHKKHRERCAAKPSRPAIPMTHTVDDVVRWLQAKQEAAGVWVCSYCGCRLTLSQVAVDHVEPLEIGGSAGLENQAIACELDNRTKGELSGVNYVHLLTVLRSMGRATELYVLTALRNVGIAKRLRFAPRKPKRAPGSPSTTSY
jgi:hypothetical protein